MESFKTHPTLPLGAVVAAVVALDDALALPRFAQARHHARVVALRAEEAEVPTIARQALRLLGCLERSIWPDASTWSPELERLHQSIDEALGA
jgi:hypothetical protein